MEDGNLQIVLITATWLSGLGVSLAGLDDALKGADAVVLLVDHDEFADIDRGALGATHLHDLLGPWRG